VRAVRGAEPTAAAEYQEKLQRLVLNGTPIPAAAMDIPLPTKSFAWTWANSR
jgi:hypothetical protein